MEKNDLVKFRSECISAHNFYRSLHATTPLIWSSKLADGAQKWAEELALADSLSYSHERGVGENIACLWGSDVTGNKVTQIWYEEAKHYNYSVPRVTPITRPFCQVIWEGSRELGAGKSTTKNGKQIVVARYNPPATRRNAEHNVKKPRLDRIDGDSSLVPHSLGLRKFQEECLFAHNEFRVLHGSPPLHWSPSLAWAAQQWAEELVRMGELKHNDDEMVGENLAGMVGDELTGKECTDMWYDEVSEYDYDNPGYSEDTSNFTQVVWIGSELFGVGRATHDDLCFVVAFYEPPGNIVGLFGENVRKPGTKVKTYRLIKEAKTFIPPSPDLDWFRVECLVAHNYFRARHGATPLVSAHGLHEEAQYWAERLLVTGATEDLQESRIGINVAVIEGQLVSGLKVTELWYQESASYDFEIPGFSLQTRSFTQLLWLTSRKLGVGKACNDNGQCVVVARYEPVGNIDGLFVNNVRKRGHERSSIEPMLFERDVKYRMKVDGRRSLRMSWEIEGAMLQAENKHHDQTRLVWIESPVLPRRRMRPESSDLEKDEQDKSDEDKESGVEEGEDFDIEGTEPEAKEGSVLSRVAYFEQFEKMEKKPKRSSFELKPDIKKGEHEESVCQLEYDDVFPKHDEHDERDDDFASEGEVDDDDDDGMSLETVSEADEDLLGELDEFEMDHHIKSYCYEDNYVREQDEDNVLDDSNYIREETERQDLSPDQCHAVEVKRSEATAEHLQHVDHIFEFIPRKDERNRNINLNNLDMSETETERKLFQFEATKDQPGRYSGPVCVEEVRETHCEKPESALHLDEMVTRFDEAEKPKPKPPPTLPKPKRNKQEIKKDISETITDAHTRETKGTVPYKIEKTFTTAVEQKEENKSDIYSRETTETVIKKEEVSKEIYSQTLGYKEEVSEDNLMLDTRKTMVGSNDELSFIEQKEVPNEIYRQDTTDNVHEKKEEASTVDEIESVPMETHTTTTDTTEAEVEKEEEDFTKEQKEDAPMETYTQEGTEIRIEQKDEVSTIHHEVLSEVYSQETEETTETVLEKEEELPTIQQEDEDSKETYALETRETVREKEEELPTIQQEDEDSKETYALETGDTVLEKEEKPFPGELEDEARKETHVQETTETILEKEAEPSTVQQEDEVQKETCAREKKETMLVKELESSILEPKDDVQNETYPNETLEIVEQKEGIPKETELNTSNEEEQSPEVSDTEDTIEVIDIAHIDIDRRVNRILNRLGRHIGFIALDQSTKKGEISNDIDLSETEHEKALFDLYTPSTEKRAWGAGPIEEEMITAEEKIRVESELPWDELFKDEDEKEVLGTVKRHMLQEKRRSVSFKETVIIQEHEAVREEPLQDEFEYCEEESEEDLKTYSDEIEDVGKAKSEGDGEISDSSRICLSHEVEYKETTEVASDVLDSEEESAETLEEEYALSIEKTGEDRAQGVPRSEDTSEEYECDVDEPEEYNPLEELSVKSNLNEALTEDVPSEVFVQSLCYSTYVKSEERTEEEVKVKTLQDEERKNVEAVLVPGISEGFNSTVCVTSETVYHQNSEMIRKVAPSIEAEIYDEKDKQTQEASYTTIVPNGHTPDSEEALGEAMECEQEAYDDEEPEVLDALPEMSAKHVKQQEENEELEEEPLHSDDLLEYEVLSPNRVNDICSSPALESYVKFQEEEADEDKSSVEEEPANDFVLIGKDTSQLSFIDITKDESVHAEEKKIVLEHKAEGVEQVEEKEPKAKDVDINDSIEHLIENIDTREDVVFEYSKESIELELKKTADVGDNKEYENDVGEQLIEDVEEMSQSPENAFRIETKHETIESEDEGAVSKIVTHEETAVEESDNGNSSLTKNIVTRTVITTTTTSRVITSDKPSSSNKGGKETFHVEQEKNLQETAEDTDSQELELKHEARKEEVTEENQKTENRVLEVGRSDNFDFHEKEPKLKNIKQNLETSDAEEKLEGKVEGPEQLSNMRESPVGEQSNTIDEEERDKYVKEDDEHLLRPKLSDDRFGYISEEELEETEELYVALRESSEEKEYEENVGIDTMLVASREEEKFEPSEDDIAYDSEVITEVEKEITSALVVKESFSLPICDDDKDTPEEDNQNQQNNPLHPLQFVDVEKSKECLDNEESMPEELQDVIEESEGIESSDENVTEKVQLVQFTEETKVKEEIRYEQDEEQRDISPTHSFEEDEEDFESSGELMENVELIQFSEKDDDIVEQASTQPFERPPSPPPCDNEEKDLDSSQDVIVENVEMIQFSEKDDLADTKEEEKDVGSSEDIEDDSVELIQFSETSGEEKIVEFDSKEELVLETQGKTVQLIQFTEQDEEVSDSKNKDESNAGMDASDQVESSQIHEFSEDEKGDRESTKEEIMQMDLSEEKVDIEEQTTKEDKFVAPCIPIVLTEFSNSEQQQEDAELYMLKDTKDGDFISVVDAPLACSTPIDIADAKLDDTFDDSGEAGFGEGFDVIDRIVAHDDLDELQRSFEGSHDDSFRYVEAEEVATKAETEDLDGSLQSPRYQVVEENITETEQEKSELNVLTLLEKDIDKGEGRCCQEPVSPPPTIFATEFVAEEEEEGSEEEYIPNFDHPRVYMVEEKELVIDPSNTDPQASDTVDSSIRPDVTADIEYPSEMSTASELSQSIEHEGVQDDMQSSYSTVMDSKISDIDDLEEEDNELFQKRHDKMEEVFLQEEIDIENIYQGTEESKATAVTREERVSQLAYATSTVITRQESPREHSYRDEQATFIMQEDEQQLLEKEPRQEDFTADEAMTEDDFRSDGNSSKADESFEDIDGIEEESKTRVEGVYQEELVVSKLEPAFEEEASETHESCPINVDIAFTEEVEIERVSEFEEPPKTLDGDKVAQAVKELDVYQEEVEIQRLQDCTDNDVFEEEVEIKRMEDTDKHKETHQIQGKTSITAVYGEELEIVAEKKQDSESIEESDGIVLAEPISSDTDNANEERGHALEGDTANEELVQGHVPEENDSPESDQQRDLEEYEIEDEDRVIPNEIPGIVDQDNIYDNNNNESMTRYYVDYSPGDSFERDSTASDDPELYRQGEPMEEDMEEFILVKYGSGHSHSDSSDEGDLSDHREMYVIPEEESEERVQQDQEPKDEPDETVFYEQGFMNPALEDINEEEEEDEKDKESPKDDDDDIEEKRQLEEYERLESFVMLEEKLSQVESDESMEDLTSGTGEKRSSSDETLNEDDELADTTNTSSTLKDEVASKEGSGDESSGELEKTLTTEEEEIIDLEDGGVLSKRTTREETYSVEEMNDGSDGDKDKTLTRKRISKKVITTTTTSATHVIKVPSEEHSDEERDVKENDVIEEMAPSQETMEDENAKDQAKHENTSSIKTEQETIELEDGGVVSKIVTREEMCTYDDDDDLDHGDDSSVTKKTITRKVVTTTTTTTSKCTPLSETVLCLTEGDVNSSKVEDDSSSETLETVIKSRQNGEDIVDQSTKRQLSREGSFAEACAEPLRKRRGFSVDSPHDSEEHSSPTDSTGESTGRSNEDLLSAEEDYSGLDDFQRDCIVQHNIYRHQHRACRLIWSEELSKAAGAWAEHLAASNSLEHASEKEQGENLASAKGYELRGDKVAEMWYDEVKDYNFETPAFNAKCGHFTQMIWRDTKQFGVAKSTAADGTQYVVARYYPPGNILGEFKTGIRRARGQRSSVRKRRRSSARRRSSQTDSGDVITQQEKFKNECIVSHNYYRSLHGAQPLQWSTRLAIESQNFAEKLVRSGSFMHSGDKEIGECLAFSFGSELSGRDAVDSWYDEIVDYDHEFPGFTSHTGNFTQLVWQGTREFGMGKAVGEDGSCVVVGRYYPPGNQVGNFQENVKQKQPGYF